VAYLLDTNLLVRLANTADPLHSVATNAVATLRGQGDVLWITPQNLIEFRSVATRPASANGLGLSPSQSESKAIVFEAAFQMLADGPAIYSAWKALVSAVGVIGKQVHDARLAAVCHANGVDHLLTFNVADFARLAVPAPGIIIVDPRSV
jgi:predicted nucleic acid-binding protein